MITYAVTTLLCLTVSEIYSRFSHGVSSPFMTWLFCFPLFFGVAAFLLFGLFRLSPMPRLAFNCYNSAVAALSVWSLLRGILEIAGTDSPLLGVLVAAGILLFVVTVVVWLHSSSSKVT